MISIENIHKSFGRHGEIQAVDGVSFSCPDGGITGLLGPNGAGKTTTLRLIAGLIRPQKGTVIVDGIDVLQDPAAVRRLLGVQTDHSGVYPRLTAREHLRYYGKFYGLRGPRLEERVAAVLTNLAMDAIADRRAEGFSRGERQKIILGRALVHDPRHILLDEPTTGLDVMAVRDTRQTIRTFRDQGRCVLFSTHYMDEAERLCDQIAIIAGGKITAFGTPEELKAQAGKVTLEEAFVTLAGIEGLRRSEFGWKTKEQP